MTATSLRTEDGRAALRIERSLAHPPEKVWRALTEPSHLNQWFPFDVEPELAVGGTLRFLDIAGGSPTSGVITDLEPPRLIAYNWEDDHLRWDLLPAEGGCTLVLTHTVADRYGSASFATGWHACIDGLGQVLAGRPVEFPGDMDAGHERFIIELGLDRGLLTDSSDGWRVRYERQLVRPAEVGWRLLVSGEDPAVGGPVPAGFVPRGMTVGPVAAMTAGRVVEYEWFVDGGVGGRVRWEFRRGTGHGARLVVSQSGSADRVAPIDGWREHIERFASGLAGVSPPDHNHGYVQR
jgi:uncharacterized protein YndB with AHSA1/START domain